MRVYSRERVCASFWLNLSTPRRRSEMCILHLVGGSERVEYEENKPVSDTVKTENRTPKSLKKKKNCDRLQSNV